MNLDRRLLRLAAQSRILFFLTILLGFAAGVLAVSQARLLSRVVARVFLGRHSLEQVSSLLVILLGIILLRAGLSWASEISASAIAIRVKTSLRQHLFEHIQTLGPIYARGERTGELISVQVEGIEALDAYFSQYLPQLILAILIPLTFLAFIFPLDWPSGLVLLFTAPLIPLFMVLIGSLAQTLTHRQWHSLSRMSAYFLDVLQGLTTLKMLGRSRAQAQVIEQVGERFRQVTMSVLRVTFLSALTLEMASTLSTAVVAVEIGLRLLYGQLSFEQAFFVLILTPEFYLPLRLLGAKFHAGMSGAAAAKRIFEVLDQPVSRPLPRQADTSPLVVTATAPITFNSVAFSYAPDRPALQDVSFTIPAGDRVALVGPSGAGKSTLAALLLRFIDPDRGQILLDGKPLTSLSSDAWRAQVAWLPQNPYLFNDTVMANIRLAKPDATQDRVIHAARLAHADEFIRELPEGYDTMIGERGARLSGGQAQRIALARAFLSSAPFIILDEATSNLDPQHEALLQESLDRLLQGRTVLIIAHRLNTVVNADQIIVLSEGRVVQTGSHAHLLAQDGLYRRLVSASAEDSAPASSSPPKTDPGSQTYFESVSHPEMPTPRVNRSPLAVLIFLLRLAAPFTGLILFSTLAGFATIGSSIGLMTTSAYIISAAALQPSIAELQVAIVGVRFFGIARGVFRYLERYLSHQVTFHLLTRLRVWFYQALEPLAPARLFTLRSGDLLARILGDIASLENFYVRVLAPPLVALLVSIAAYAYLAGFTPRLGLTLLGFLGIAGIVLPWLIHRLSRSPGHALVEQRAILSATLVDSIQGMPDILACNQGNRRLERLTLISQVLARAQRRLAALNAWQTALSAMLAHLGMWVVLLLSIPLVSSAQIPGVYLSVLALAALTSFEAAAPLPLAAQHLESSLQAAARLLEIANERPAVSDPDQPQPIPADFSLEVKDLSFAYPGNEENALSNLSFSLPYGKCVAIVGPSGAGKSTLVNLLLRFWDYSSGQILLGNSDLRSYAQEALRSRIGVVPQHTYLFSASVSDNLRLARPEASQAEIIQAAERAHIHDFIQTLPDGYETWIGEQGLRLSAGERQRLAIARAILKDAPLLILDEATANLDALTERDVVTSIRQLMQGRTTLLITHRLVDLQHMDEILVLDRGRVIERGCHTDLIAMNGLYRQMWDLQRKTLSTSVYPSRYDV
jgi:ATP-binding cassette subfamily C protein CydCD